MWLSHHYKQDIQNKFGDRLSILFIELTVQHEALSTDQIKAILSLFENQDDHEGVWAAILAVTKQLEIDSKELFSDRCVSCISKY